MQTLLQDPIYKYGAYLSRKDKELLATNDHGNPGWERVRRRSRKYRKLKRRAKKCYGSSRIIDLKFMAQKLNRGV